MNTLQQLITAHRELADSFKDNYSTFDIEVGWDGIINFSIWSGIKEVFIKGPTFQSALDAYNDLMNDVKIDLSI